MSVPKVWFKVTEKQLQGLVNYELKRTRECLANGVRKQLLINTNLVKISSKVGGEAERHSKGVGSRGKHDFAKKPFGLVSRRAKPKTKAGRGFSAPQTTKKRRNE